MLSWGLSWAADCHQVHSFMSSKCTYCWSLSGVQQSCWLQIWSIQTWRWRGPALHVMMSEDTPGLVWEVCRNNSWFTHRGKIKTKLNPHKHKRTIPEPKMWRRGAVKQTQWWQEQQRLTDGLWGQKPDFTHGLFSKRHGAIISGWTTGL